MRNIALVVSYDGTDYQGFQSQPGGRTIQDRLEHAILALTGEPVRITGSGRTDAGVHARAQTVNFPTSSAIPIERWAIALNTRLPDDIVVRKAWVAPDGFNARHHAVSKTYRYTINCNRVPDLFRRRYEFHHPTPLDIGAMREALRPLVGEHDFTSFASPLSTKPSHVRMILEARLELERESTGEDSFDPAYGAEWDAEHYPGKSRGIVHLYVKGTGFLYNMVRIIAGTLIHVGEGKIPPERVADILAAKDRSQAGPTAVAKGLSLWEVAYDPDESVKL
ncbi:tRNA pseudouridine(38-40) synthase TruA [Paenibacillaceae bacterium WGS1546]|uniref:tRNA pseudouridine(38-40) synthase TruA n=1 Tax=Cohnella sp. WGS1546 TaxID=3366810 RepID=UPI00372CEE4F